MMYNPSERFQKEKCIGCGVCLQVCPESAITTDSVGIVSSFNKCINCGHCGSHCPQNCFNLPSLTYKSLPLPETIQNLFEKRRSVRVFTDKKISNSVIRSLLEAVNNAPTGRNLQGITVSVINDKEMIYKMIVKPVIKTLKIIDFLGFISLLAGSEKHLIKKIKRGEDLITHNAPCILFFNSSKGSPTGKSDAVIAATMVSIKAESMGLGVFWNGVVQMISPFLSTKKKHAVLCLGYPALEQFQVAPLREWKRVDYTLF